MSETDIRPRLEAKERDCAQLAREVNELRAVVRVFMASSHSWVGPNPTDAEAMAKALGLRTVTTLGQIDADLQRLVTFVGGR